MTEVTTEVATIGCMMCGLRFRIRSGVSLESLVRCPYCQKLTPVSGVATPIYLEAMNMLISERIAASEKRLAEREEVIPRYLVLLDDEAIGDYESEAEALADTEVMAGKMSHPLNHGAAESLEVVRSVRRWEVDVPTGEFLEVGERLVQEQPV